MNGVAGGGAGRLYFKNSSATTGVNNLILDVDSGEAIAPYIPDNGVLFKAGAYVNLGATDLADNVTVFYDG